ncbi:hypothetical protein [Microcoleus sp. F10-A1]|uniref:hypothetical protein n=1 Tax=Microcoleus sp. F10-A1 TaxID=2818750 RepID=UPI002FCF65E8
MYTYTATQLEHKTLGELKSIARELNIALTGDRRCRQTWIDAVVGAQLPLLALIETSPGATTTTFSTNDRVCINSGFFSGMTGRVMRGSTSFTIRVEFDRRHDASGAYCGFIGRDCLTLLTPAVLTASVIEIQRHELIEQALKTSPGAQIEPVHEPIDLNTGKIFPLQEPIDLNTGKIFPLQEPIDLNTGKIFPLQEPIVPAVKTSPGVDCVQKPKSIAHELLELFKSSVQEPSAQPVETSPGAQIEPVHESIPQSLETSPGVTFSPKFLARYSPPQPENIFYKADIEGQLSLLDFEIQSESEPPDPDDFESLDAFREAIALWDAQNPELLQVSLDSFCEWAPCPDDWYEPDTLLELSEVMEVSLLVESSITCKFLIPVFGFPGNRATGTDEPPTAGAGARLPKPKPPSFPPMGVVAGDRVNLIKFVRSAILLSERAPPGGDAVF